jgi:hypothetical protein
MEASKQLERELRELARDLYRAASEHKPSLFEAEDWIGRMVDWSLEDESLRSALFRFVDVLPSLDSSAEIGRHLEEYFARVDHALGGLVSRSPAHIEQARREFRVGNLYINRGIIGAVVERQPFGGLKPPGIGSKSGGPDYLLQFVEPRTISENTLCHGFVPPEELQEK